MPAAQAIHDVAEILDYWSLLAGESEWHSPAPANGSARRRQGRAGREITQELGEARAGD